MVTSRKPSEAAAGIDSISGAVGGHSELAFVAWLLVKGVRVPP